MITILGKCPFINNTKRFLSTNKQKGRMKEEEISKQIVIDKCNIKMKTLHNKYSLQPVICTSPYCKQKIKKETKPKAILHYFKNIVQQSEK